MLWKYLSKNQMVELISEELDCKSKSINRHTERLHLYKRNENIINTVTIINLNALKTDLKYIKQYLAELQGEMDRSSHNWRFHTSDK